MFSRLVVSSASDKVQRFLMNALGVFLLLAAAWAFVNGNIEAASLATLAFLSRFVLHVVEQKYKLILPIEFHATVYFFMFAALFLGSANGLYEWVWWWDLALHFTSGIIAGFGAYLVLYTLHLQSRLAMTPLMVAFFTFCAGLAIGAVWEIWEYLADITVGANSQGNLQDTMQDLVFDALGALVISAAGYFYLKKQESKRNPIKRLVANFERHNPGLFKEGKK